MISMTFKKIVLLAAVVMALVSGGCNASVSIGSDTTSTPTTDTASSAVTVSDTILADYEVLIENHAFKPDSLTIHVGDTVKWTNNDAVGHSIVFDEFESGLLKKGDSYTHLFDTAGTFTYKCGPHPDMTATIEVQ